MADEKTPDKVRKEFEKTQKDLEDKLKTSESTFKPIRRMSKLPDGVDKELYEKALSSLAGLKLTDKSGVTRIIEPPSFRDDPDYDVSKTRGSRFSAPKENKTTRLTVQAFINDIMLSSLGIGNALGLEAVFSEVIPSMQSGKWSLSVTIQERPKTDILSIEGPKTIEAIDESHYIKPVVDKTRWPKLRRRKR